MPPEMAPTFDAALSDVSDFLSDARNLERRGHVRRALSVYALAETYALRSGFLELVQLVWVYAPVPAVSRRSW